MSDLDVSDTTTESDEGDDDRDDASTRDEQKQPVTTEEASFVNATSQLVLPSPVNGHFTLPLPLALVDAIDPPPRSPYAAKVSVAASVPTTQAERDRHRYGIGKEEAAKQAAASTASVVPVGAQNVQRAEASIDRDCRLFRRELDGHLQSILGDSSLITRELVGALAETQAHFLVEELPELCGHPAVDHEGNSSTALIHADVQVGVGALGDRVTQLVWTALVGKQKTDVSLTGCSSY